MREAEIEAHAEALASRLDPDIDMAMLWKIMEDRFGTYGPQHTAIARRAALRSIARRLTR